ncbi:MAG: hypothetical protein MK097_14340, partial [Dechloromonas sp.]|nr:hypothetical protein [Dechloromonas sp.]
MAERLLGLAAILLAIVIAGLALFWKPEMPERPIPRAPIVAGGDFTLQSVAGPVRSRSGERNARETRNSSMMPRRNWAYTLLALRRPPIS